MPLNTCAIPTLNSSDADTSVCSNAAGVPGLETKPASALCVRIPSATPPPLNRVTAESAAPLEPDAIALAGRAEAVRDDELRRIEEHHVVVAARDADVAQGQRARPGRKREDDGHDRAWLCVDREARREEQCKGRDRATKSHVVGCEG